MYDRVKRRRKSTDADVYSEEHEGQEEERGANENDNSKAKEATRTNNGDDNTMDVLNPDEDDDDDDDDDEEEEDMNHQQTGKYSLRERKPPIQRFSLYGRERERERERSSLTFAVGIRTTTAETQNNLLWWRRWTTVELSIASITATRVILSSLSFESMRILLLLFR